MVRKTTPPREVTPKGVPLVRPLWLSTGHPGWSVRGPLSFGQDTVHLVRYSPLFCLQLPCSLIQCGATDKY